jgi:hypothetical protein
MRMHTSSFWLVKNASGATLFQSDSSSRVEGPNRGTMGLAKTYPGLKNEGVRARTCSGPEIFVHQQILSRIEASRLSRC